MRAIFYKFNKKSNSTAIPNNSTPSIEFNNVQIKTPSSIHDTLIQLAKGTDVTGYNYVYLPSFNRYYFINDISYNLGIWLVSCNVDVLASFRDDILDSRQYVLRSASQYNDNITDTLYTTEASDDNNTDIAYAPNSVVDVDNSTTISNYFNVDYTDGYFVIGVIGNNNSGVTYYQLKYNGFKQVMSSLLNYVPSDFSDVSRGIAKSLLDPLQYITSCFWLPIPFNITYLPTPISINIGGYSILIDGSQNATPIFTRKAHLRTTITVPKHPQSSARAYTQLEPFSRYNLVFEPFGNIPLDTTKLYGTDTLRLDWYVDIATMESELFVYNNTTGALISNVRSNIGVEVALSQIKVDVLSGVNSIASGFGGAVGNVLNGDIGGAIMSAIGGITSTTASMLPQLSTSGGISSFLSYSLGAPQLHAFYIRQVDDDITRYGKPLCEVKKLVNLSGYALCSNAVVNYSASTPLALESDEVNSLLNSGVYIE